MRRTLEIAGRNPRTPFGTVIVSAVTGKCVAEGLNRSHDNPIWHGEMDALIHCAPDTDYSDLVLYTSAEPCPMCQTAILWAGIRRVVYSVSADDLRIQGWHQFTLTAEDIVAAGWQPCAIVGGVLREQGQLLFDRALQLRRATH